MNVSIQLGDASHVMGEVVEVTSGRAYGSSESDTAFVRIRRPDQTLTWLAHFGRAAKNPGWSDVDHGPVQIGPEA